MEVLLLCSPSIFLRYESYKIIKLKKSKECKKIHTGYIGEA
jgi:hypothetical protein